MKMLSLLLIKLRGCIVADCLEIISGQMLENIMTENKGLNAKIGNIQKDIESLVKDEKNKNLNYKYFEESQILKILKPLLEREKLTLKISDDDTQPLQ